MKIDIQSVSEDEIIFELAGVDASIANALRRIILAEVPTVAIENVWIITNSGIIQDEVLAHRVGLVPIKVDPRLLKYVQSESGETDEDTLVFHLNVHNRNMDDVVEPGDTSTYVGPSGKVLSKHLTWIPIETQKEIFADGGVSVVNPDILLTKLGPGQAVEFEAHCCKGIGKDHAKFQPVATVSYRLKPDISFKKDDIVRGMATELKELCPTGVFDIEEMGNEVKALVAHPERCTMCGECVRTPRWNDMVALKRKHDTFVFTVESLGAVPPQKIVEEALKILGTKCRNLIQCVTTEQ